jgi:transposase InsO family protein
VIGEIAETGVSPSGNQRGGPADAGQNGPAASGDNCPVRRNQDITPDRKPSTSADGTEGTSGIVPAGDSSGKETEFAFPPADGRDVRAAGCGGDAAGDPDPGGGSCRRAESPAAEDCPRPHPGVREGAVPAQADPWLVKAGASGEMTFTGEMDIASQRVQLISPLIGKGLSKSQRAALTADIANMEGCSARTLYRYLTAFRRNGIQGLVPKGSGPRGSRSIRPNIFSEAVNIRKECPRRSVREIIAILEGEGLIEPGEVKRATLQDQFFKSGMGAGSLRDADRIKKGGSAGRFQHGSRNALWQSDIKYGPIINKLRTYLISFLDDRSRFILHAEFYRAQSLDEVMHCFEQAVLKYGVPEKVLFDNGSQYVSQTMVRTCSLLGARIYRTKPYKPQGKGKIERYHQVIDRFITEFNLMKDRSFPGLQERFQAWLTMRYQDWAHESLDGKTPRIVFDSDREPLRLASREDVSYAFLRVQKNRKVDKSGCVNFNGQKWDVEGGCLMVGRNVDILYDRPDPVKIFIECPGHDRREARRLVIKPWVGKRQVKPAGDSPPRSGESRLLNVAMAAKGDGSADACPARPIPEDDGETAVVEVSPDVSSDPEFTGTESAPDPPQRINFRDLEAMESRERENGKAGSRLLDVARDRKGMQDMKLSECISYLHLNGKDGDG